MTVIDLREYGPEFTANPHPYYAALRASGPVHEIITPEGWPAWLIVGYDEARAALADQRFAKDSAFTGFVPPEVEIIGPHLLAADPPDHTRMRKLVAREFTGRRVEALRPRVRQLADELLDMMAPARRGDLVDSFAFPLPITVICELLGVPVADRDTFRAWSHEIVAPSGAVAEEEAIKGFAAYLDTFIEDKRAAGPGDDLLSALIAARAEDGDRLSLPELRGLIQLLIVAGHETTVNLISATVRLLLTHPDQLKAVRADFGLLPGAIEEVLRHDGPVETATYRFTREDVTIGDTVIPARSVAVIGIASAGRDPGRFPEPDRFDIHRDTRGHLGFGHGIHFCLGAPLARLEGEIAVRALLERFPRLALDPEAPPLEWMPSILIRGPRHLPVLW
ncbi:cytochrome P450 family protein [Streptomyces laurentii]|uniref:cytochrome P450 family protein n=1 Tax=Streptomyces laurentii TaxID=39478 RepID=UPI00368DB925